jgi:hypothetical protein
MCRSAKRKEKLAVFNGGVTARGRLVCAATALLCLRELRLGWSWRCRGRRGRIRGCRLWAPLLKLERRQGFRPCICGRRIARCRHTYPNRGCRRGAMTINSERKTGDEEHGGQNCGRPRQQIRSSPSGNEAPSTASHSKRSSLGALKEDDYDHRNRNHDMNHKKDSGHLILTARNAGEPRHTWPLFVRRSTTIASAAGTRTLCCGLNKLLFGWEGQVSQVTER